MPPLYHDLERIIQIGPFYNEVEAETVRLLAR